MMMMMIVLRKIGKCWTSTSVECSTVLHLMPPVLLSETCATVSSDFVFIHFVRILRLYFHSIFCTFVLFFFFCLFLQLVFVTKEPIIFGFRTPVSGMGTLQASFCHCTRRAESISKLDRIRERSKQNPKVKRSYGCAVRLQSLFFNWYRQVLTL